TYYNDPRADESFTKDGWLRTGDVAVISPEGYIRLVDRTKDLVKSGGEWISSVELENEIMAHPKVAEAAVIGVPHERWVERRLAAQGLEAPGAAGLLGLACFLQAVVVDHRAHPLHVEPDELVGEAADVVDLDGSDAHGLLLAEDRVRLPRSQRE